MKWYYQWKLRKIQREINALRDLSSERLVDNYTINARLRSLTKLAEYLERRLDKPVEPPVQHQH